MPIELMSSDRAEQSARANDCTNGAVEKPFLKPLNATDKKTEQVSQKLWPKVKQFFERFFGRIRKMFSAKKKNVNSNAGVVGASHTDTSDVRASNVFSLSHSAHSRRLSTGCLAPQSNSDLGQASGSDIISAAAAEEEPKSSKVAQELEVVMQSKNWTAIFEHFDVKMKEGPDEKGNYVLHYLAMLDIAQNQRIKTLETIFSSLYRRKINLNVQNAKGESLAHLAAEKKDYDLLKILQKHNAKFDILDNVGRTVEGMLKDTPVK